jgi:tRNA pseudouridine32 synthase / 23S rRNA pseudouridine746 synthase
VEKSYLAIVRGVPDPQEGTVSLPILEHRTSRPELLARALKAAYGPARAGNLLAGKKVGAIPPVPAPGRSACHPAGRPASTGYRVVRSARGLSLVELHPAGGRMHQLRVHLLAIGTPISGDPLYDDAPSSLAEPFLHAFRLVWRNPPGGEADAWTFTSKPLLPAPFDRD